MFSFRSAALASAVFPSLTAPSDATRRPIPSPPPRAGPLLSFLTPNHITPHQAPRAKTSCGRASGCLAAPPARARCPAPVWPADPSSSSCAVSSSRQGAFLFVFVASVFCIATSVDLSVPSPRSPDTQRSPSSFPPPGMATASAGSPSTCKERCSSSSLSRARREHNPYTKVQQ